MAEGRRDRIPCALMRAGSNKGVCLLTSDLPKDRHARDELILTAFGNPDPGEYEGLVAGAPWTNVVALVSPATSHAAPKGAIEVSFGRIVPDIARIDYTTVSGDFFAAVAQFAIDRGLVTGSAPATTVHLIDQISRLSVTVELPTRAAQVPIQIPPQPGLVQEPLYRVTFNGLGNTTNGQTRALFPTGQQREGVASGYGEYIVSIVDAVTPVVFVNAEFLGLSGPELPDDFDDDDEFYDHVDSIRAAAAETLGYVRQREQAWEDSPISPRVVTIFEATEYDDIEGHFISVMDFDLTCREVSLDEMHYSLDLEVAVCTAVAAHMDGTVVWDAMLREDAPRVVRLGHPSGVISVEVAIDRVNGATKTISATAEIPVRPIFDGYVYLPMGRAA